jgi:hypothetical protein
MSYFNHKLQFELKKMAFKYLKVKRNVDLRHVGKVSGCQVNDCDLKIKNNHDTEAISRGLVVKAEDS